MRASPIRSAICCEAARALGLSFGIIKLMGGGARSATWRQIIADVTGLVVERPGNGDASFGAALVAGIGVGFYADPQRGGRSNASAYWTAASPIPGATRSMSEFFAIYKRGAGCVGAAQSSLHAILEKAPKPPWPSAFGYYHASNACNKSCAMLFELCRRSPDLRVRERIAIR